ncbi:MAG: hypothetical protein H7Y02_00175 [Candidatus Obscuribacterales bacterium]|nr:hypothetical protein [Steroidobacteraceae bacterium]
MLTRKRDLRRLLSKPRNMLLTWAAAKLGAAAGGEISFRVRSLDFRTIWAARQLQMALGWRPLLEQPAIGYEWLGWEIAIGTEPLLDCSDTIQFANRVTGGSDEA